jgi:hypothetical protein
VGLWGRCLLCQLSPSGSVRGQTAEATRRDETRRKRDRRRLHALSVLLFSLLAVPPLCLLCAVCFLLCFVSSSSVAVPFVLLKTLYLLATCDLGCRPCGVGSYVACRE